MDLNLKTVNGKKIKKFVIKKVTNLQHLKGQDEVNKTSKIVVSADSFNNFEKMKLNGINNKREENAKFIVLKPFEEVNIKTEVIDNFDKVEGETNSGDVVTNVAIVSKPSNVTTNNLMKPQATTNNNKSVVIINADGKPFKIIPKTKPVILNKCKRLVKTVPNVQAVNLSETNKFQKYLFKTKTQVMPNFSKILNVLAETPKKPITLTQHTPIYVEKETQTNNQITFKDSAVQTETLSSTPSPTHSIEELPNITNLLEYIFKTPSYSSGLDESKKSDLIGMSKNITMKGKCMEQESIKLQNREDYFKFQLFTDLRDCVTFDFLGNKPIHNAVLENNMTLLKRQVFALRLRKTSIDIDNNQGQTALQIAVINNCNFEIISFLLDSGANFTVIDNEGNNLLHLAVMNSTREILEVLLRHFYNKSIEINGKNDEGLTALMISSIEQKPDMVETLLRFKADPNVRDEKSGRTALFHAVELNSNLVINLLLKYKADPKVRNYFGLTALDAAKDLDIPEAKMLEGKEVNVNIIKSPVKRVIRVMPEKEQPIKKSKLKFVKSLQKVRPNVYQQIVRNNEVHKY